MIMKTQIAKNSPKFTNICTSIQFSKCWSLKDGMKWLCVLNPFFLLRIMAPTTESDMKKGFFFLQQGFAFAVA